MLYDEEQNVISFTKDAVIGNYQAQLTLTDHNEVDPQSKVYFFSISIEKREPTYEKIIEDATTPDEDRPNFQLQSMSYIGDLVVFFD